jgi:2-polyprenyl-3-methyl-5-hydroxy-6-metoxy-1,4-benzoquinol methylase
MASVTSLINSILLWLINIPQLNIKFQYISRPINKHKKALSSILKNIIYSRVLDYGCGEGFFSDCFSQSKYCGYDIDIKKIIYAKKRFVNYKFLTEIPEFSMFDLFFFNNVLHHMNPSHASLLINEVSKSTKRNAHLMIIELKPKYQQTSFIYKLILHIESSIHYSEPRPVNFYKQEMQNSGFALIDKKDLGAFYLLLFKK